MAFPWHTSLLYIILYTALMYCNKYNSFCHVAAWFWHWVVLVKLVSLACRWVPHVHFLFQLGNLYCCKDFFLVRSIGGFMPDFPSMGISNLKWFIHHSLSSRLLTCSEKLLVFTHRLHSRTLFELQFPLQCYVCFLYSMCLVHEDQRICIFTLEYRLRNYVNKCFMHHYNIMQLVVANFPW